MSLCYDCCCQVEVFATGRSLFERSRTECGVSECDRETSIMRRPWPTGGCCAMGADMEFSRYRGADKSLVRPTSRCILFDGGNISFDPILVIYIYIYIYIYIVLIFLQL
jgi:hypothetical protein